MREIRGCVFGTVGLGISCELVLMMTILCCVCFYGMKCENGSLYGNYTLLFCECNVDN